MKHILLTSFFAGCLAFIGVPSFATDFSCGPGYILVSHSDIDDIDAAVRSCGVVI